MTYKGHIHNGVVVLDGAPALPDGLEVLVEAAPPEKAATPTDEALNERLMKYAGKARGLPPDASRNHDHYLYGTPKR